jgi:hypothetical protein
MKRSTPTIEYSSKQAKLVAKKMITANQNSGKNRMAELIPMIRNKAVITLVISMN